MNSPKRIIYFFALAFASSSIYLQYFAVDTHALSADYTIKLCERNFYGSNYKPYLKPKCDILWSKWTYDILNTIE